MNTNSPFKMTIVVIVMMCLCGTTIHCQTQAKDPLRYDIGTVSIPGTAPVTLKLTARFQSYNASPKNKNDNFDMSIHSPKSVTFSSDGNKFYVQSLEGYTTTVYDAHSLNKIKVIKHIFTAADSNLFVNGEFTVFDYQFKDKKTNYNIFSGKPVESCLSHNGKYLWVTYYRRDYDQNAQMPSAVAIIDTENDSIVRVMPTGPLPKMIACSPNNKYIAVTHWGDNTVGIIDITGDVNEFKYISHCIVDYRAKLDFGSGYVNRDQQCGHCLRGTVFTPDSKYLLVGKMGGGGGIAIFDMSNFDYLGTVTGMKTNLRHLVINNGEIILSSNTGGFVQKTSLDSLLKAKLAEPGKTVIYSSWRSCYVGAGARTIDVTADGKYIFACVNNECKVAVVRASDMKKICTINADAYPVGMALSPDETKLVVTSQGKENKGGNSVMVFDVTIQP